MKLGISTACYYPLETEKALVAVGESEAGTAEIFFNAASEHEPSFIKELMRILYLQIQVRRMRIRRDGCSII